MKNIALIGLILLTFGLPSFTQALPKINREFPAVWVATVDNIHFPTNKDLTNSQQKGKLVNYHESAKQR